MTEYKIEKNVPMPLPAGAYNRRFPFGEMEIGDSIVIPATSRAAAHAFARTHPVKFSCRAIGDGAVRVWRIK